MMVSWALIRWSRHAGAGFVASVGVGLFLLAMSATQAWLMARTVADILAGASWHAVAPALWILTGLIVARGGLQVIREACAMHLAGVTKVRIRRHLFGHLQRLGPGYVTTAQTGALQTTLVDAVEAIEGYVGHYLPQLVVTWIGTRKSRMSCRERWQRNPDTIATAARSSDAPTSSHSTRGSAR